jgi:hypothetical protein
MLIGGTMNTSKAKNETSAAKSGRHPRVQQKLAISRWYHAVRTQWKLDRSHLEHPDVLPFDSENWLEHPPAERSLPDVHFFEQLATMARVPAAGVQRLRQAILSEINSAWGFRPKLKTVQYINMGRIEPGFMNAMRVQLRRLEESSKTLCAILHNKESLTGFVLESASNSMFPPTWGPDGEEAGFDFEQFKEMITKFVTVSSKARQLLAEYSESRRPIGRPTRDSDQGVLRVSSLTKLTLRLLWDVREAGGHLTIDKNAGRGALIEALNLLRQYMPPNHIPNQLPYSTLAGIKALDNRVVTTAVVKRNECKLSRVPVARA